MSVMVDHAAATRLLNDSLIRCAAHPRGTCPIKGTVDLVMGGRKCLTYRYIMLTALVAKATDESVDILSLQAGDESAGAYDARELAKRVVFPFQRDMLGNVLDGSNSDPLVNNPARFPRLTKSNRALGGDTRSALFALCDDLPTIRTSKDALECVEYIVTLLLGAATRRASERALVRSVGERMGVFEVRRFLSELLDQGFGGASLVLVAAVLHSLRFDGPEYSVRLHPVNQSGASSQQFSDLDVLRDGRPFLGTELKDRPFSASDVEHAADVALESGAKSLLFVAGRQSTFASQPPAYFRSVRERCERLGMYVGVSSIDDLIDTTLSRHVDADMSSVATFVYDASERIGVIEAQIWVYRRLSDARNGNLAL